MFWAKIRKISNFLMKILNFYNIRNICILHWACFRNASCNGGPQYLMKTSKTQNDLKDTSVYVSFCILCNTTNTLHISYSQICQNWKSFCFYLRDKLISYISDLNIRFLVGYASKRALWRQGARRDGKVNFGFTHHVPTMCNLLYAIGYIVLIKWNHQGPQKNVVEWGFATNIFDA